KELANLSLSPENDPIDAGMEYRFLAEKPQFDTTTVSYCQTFFGLPVWEAGLAVHMKHAPFRILGTQLTRQPDIKVAKPSARALARLKKFDAEALAELLGISHKRSAFDVKSLRVQHQRLMIYCYQKSRRGHPEDGTGEKGKRLARKHPTLP